MPYNTTAGMVLSTDSSGSLYQTVYGGVKCQGGLVFTGRAPPLQSCYCSSDACWLYSYSASMPVSTKAATVITKYSGTSCTAGSEYLYYFSYGDTSCTAAPCSATNLQSSTKTCAGFSSTTAGGTITTGYAVTTASFAATDKQCQTPTSGSLVPLGVCKVVPSTTSQPASISYKLSADSNGNLYYTLYGNTACQGTVTGTRNTR